MFLKLFVFVLSFNFMHCYQIGNSYTYTYETSAKLTTPKSLDHLIPAVKANVLIQPLGDSLLKIKINDFISDNVFDVDAIEAPILVNLNKQLIYLQSTRETSGSVLFKKGIVDMLNLNAEQQETSFIGDCSVRREFLDEATFRILKFNCSRPHLSKGEFRRNEKILNSLVDRRIEFSYKLNNDRLIQHAATIDTSKIFSEFNSRSAHTIESKQLLELVSTIKLTEQNEEISEEMFEKATLSSNIDTDDLSLKLANLKSNLRQKEKTLQQIVKQFDKKTKSGSSKTCQNYLSIVKLLRSGSVKKADAQGQLSALLSKEKLAKILLEAYLASQTDLGVDVVTNALDLNKLNEKKTKLVEALLVSSSLLSKFSTSDLLFKSVDSIIKNSNRIPRLRTQAYLTLGSLVNLASKNQIDYNKPFELLLDQNKQNIKDYNVKLVYLESLKNTKLANVYLTKIDNFKNSAKLLLSTLKYIDSIYDENLLTNDLLRDLLIIFDDSSVKEELRLEALNLLLDKYEKSIAAKDSPLLENILIKLFKRKDKTSKEFKFFCQQLIWNKMKSNSEFEKKAYELFAKKSLGVNFLDFISVNGSSIVVSAFADEIAKSGIGFKLKQLMTDDGFMRSVDLGVNYIDKEGSFVDFLKFEIYANNLNALSQTALTGKTGDPSVSLHLSVMGKKLNLAQLFKGYTEMLSLVWKLPTKMTSLFDINFLLSDQNEYLLLQNGLILRLETLGAISFDMSGKTDISIWSQTADLKFKKSTAVRIEQKLTLFNDLNILVESEFNFDTQILVDLSTDIDFSTSPSKVCVQLSNRKFYLKETSKLTSFKLNKVDSVKNVNKRTPIQPVSLMLSKQAVLNC